MICNDNDLHMVPSHDAGSSGVECRDGKASPGSKAYIQFKQLRKVLVWQVLLNVMYGFDPLHHAASSPNPASLLRRRLHKLGGPAVYVNLGFT